MSMKPKRSTNVADGVKLFTLNGDETNMKKITMRCMLKNCRYFSIEEPCPCPYIYEAILCKTKNCQNLVCPFVHQNVTNDEDKEDNIEVSDEEQEETLRLLIYIPIYFFS